MDKQSLTYKTFRNISYNVVGYIWPMFFALFITPVIIFRLGVKNYGIYIFINTVISLLGLLDVGISIAVTKYLAYYYGKNDEKAISRLITSANSLFFLIGLAGFMASVLIAFWGPSLLPAQFSNYSQYAYLFLIAGGIVFINSVGATYTIILNATQRFDISNKIGMVYLTLSSLTLLAIVLIHSSLYIIFSIQLLMAVLLILTVYQYDKKIMPQTSAKLGWNREEIKKCFRFGLISSINNIANTALASFDRLIIPLFAGPSNLTYYSVPGNVASKIPGLANTFSTTLFPTTAQLEGEEDKTKIERLYVRSFRLITIIAASFSVTAIAFAHKALLYWLSSEFATKSGGILIILVVTNFILALYGPLSNFLLGLGRVKFLTALSVTMGVINAAALLILLPKYGILGAAWAYLISVLPVVYMFYHTEKKYLVLSNRKKYYLKKFFGTIVTSIIVWAIDVYLLSPWITNFPNLLLMGGVSVVLYILIYKFLGFFESEDWQDVESFFSQIGARFHVKFGRT